MTESRYERVLVADDERVIADSLALILSRSGFEARAAYTGMMAVAMARDFQPDVLIADVVMPFMTGMEAATRVREMLPSCRIVLFSGQAAISDFLEVARAGVHEFELLVKPVHPSELIARLRRGSDVLMDESQNRADRALNPEAVTRAAPAITPASY